MQPVLFTIGPYNAYSFGLFLSLSFILSSVVIYFIGKSELKEEEYMDTYFLTSFISLIWARVIYILLNFKLFGLNFLKYIVVREQPGLELLAGIIAGYIFLILHSLKKKYSFLHMADMFSIVFSLQLFLAKIGEEMGGAGFGKETDSFFGVRIIGLLGKRHPVELYEAGFFLLIFIILLVIYKRNQRSKLPEGLYFFLFIILTSIGEFTVEFFRSGVVYLYGITFRQIFSILMVLFIIKPFYDIVVKVKKLRENIK